MKTLASLLADSVWLAAAGALAWFFPLTFLGVQAVCLTAPLALRKVERAMM